MAGDLQPYYERLYAGARELHSFGYSHLTSRERDPIIVMGTRNTKTGFIRDLDIEFKPTILELLLLASNGARVRYPRTEVVITPQGNDFHGQLYFWPRERRATAGRTIEMVDFPLAESLLKRVSGQMDHVLADTLFEYRTLNDMDYPVFPQAQ